jgi:hypothetical protein
MENPYQSPAEENIFYPRIEVVLRRRWVGRRSQQVYRFASPIEDQFIVKEMILSFYLQQKTRLVSSSDSISEFERMGTSVFYQLIIPSEMFTPHRIQVSFHKSSSGTLITCDYQIRGLLPTFTIPPWPLEKEVRVLAFACGLR